jgi:hypothetical protein
MYTELNKIDYAIGSLSIDPQDVHRATIVTVV